jgi:hypothetical protein
MNIPASLRREAFARNGGRCFNCEQRAEHLHHIVPLARGGSDLLTNLASLCECCHGRVHGRDMAHHKELTRQGLAAAKARGVQLGGVREGQQASREVRAAAATANAEALRPVLEPLEASGRLSAGV